MRRVVEGISILFYWCLVQKSQGSPNFPSCRNKKPKMFQYTALQLEFALEEIKAKGLKRHYSISKTSPDSMANLDAGRRTGSDPIFFRRS